MCLEEEQLIADRWYRLACAILATIRGCAIDGSVPDRLWLMSEEGAQWMELCGFDPEATRERLVLGWCEAKREKQAA